MARAMGIGKLGDRNLIIKRRFRWTFKVTNICRGQTVEEHFVKLAARPNLTIEETEVNFLNARTWIPGKTSWETITVTYYDVAAAQNQGLWNWLASVYQFTDPVMLKQGSQRQDYAATGNLALYDGCGQILETWEMGDMWPQAINFGELDYSSSEEANIELTLRYSNVKYKSMCPGFTPESCCTPCSG